MNFTVPVNQSPVNALISNCLGAINQGATELNIYISSPGGDLVAGFTAYHFLKALPIPVKTHNLSNVESVANIIFRVFGKSCC
ncbi:ATP-dependent Clp protease proteolytic subunit [Escherichia coli]|uniref:ATP-dependent Clp protease proteolytic subunit n=1 Tax=Escherichia coli TaxID=562 RepID=UPI00201FAD40|nr:ATP-dependent Clp protease proteolytic subunit [Escherichia coli]